MAETSFICERTAEYILVPALCEMLRPDFPTVIPMFFWRTREGNREAARSMVGLRIRLLTVFPRRPKITSGKQDMFTLKVNDSLLECSRVGAQLGVPVIAGIPCVFSFRDLRMDAKCIWFDLQPLSASRSDRLIHINCAGTVVNEGYAIAPLSGARLCSMVGSGPTYEWNQALNIIDQLRSTVPVYNRMLGGGYKPLYCVFPEEA